MKFKSLLFSSVIFLVPALLSAQPADFGNWWMYFGNKQLNTRWNLHHEIQYRNYNFAGDLEQLLIRTGIGYNLSEGNNNVLIGYGFIKSDNYIGLSDEKVSFDEHRIYQQFITNQSFGRFSLQHRYRFEQRFLLDDFRLRFRYFLNVKAALTKPTLTDKTLYFVAYTEPFINTKVIIFDRNRLYGGFGYKLNKDVSFELGYMNQYFSVGGRDQLQVGVFCKY